MGALLSRRRGFSAIGYLFAKELRDSLKVPVGVIDATSGRTTGRSVDAAATTLLPVCLPMWRRSRPRFSTSRAALWRRDSLWPRIPGQAGGGEAPIPISTLASSSGRPDMVLRIWSRANVGVLHGGHHFVATPSAGPSRPPPGNSIFDCPEASHTSPEQHVGEYGFAGAVVENHGERTSGSRSLDLDDKIASARRRLRPLPALSASRW